MVPLENLLTNMLRTQTLSLVYPAADTYKP